MKSKVVIVTEYFYPRDKPDSRLLTDISRAIAEASNGDFEVVCNSGLHGVELSVVVFRKLNKGDKLFAVTNPAFLLVIFAVFKKLKKFHYTLLVYDIFPENLPPAGLIKESSLLYKWVKKIFDWSYSKANLLVVIGRDMQQLVTAKTGGKVPTVLIPNWCDTDAIIPSAKADNPIIQQYDLEHKTVFAFTGNFGRVQGIDNLLKAASLVSHKDFVLLFIGEGAMRPAIEKHIAEHPKGNIIYAGSFPSTEQNIFLNACDIAIVSLNEGMYGLGVPSKSYYNMAAGKPILYVGHQKSEIAQLIHEHSIGWSCPPNDINALSAMMWYICEHKEELLPYGANARLLAQNNFSKKIVLQKYFDLYKDFQ
ncbi:MAG: glycosyltransferase family 4 protein [Epsilonproteobacteria bacterium]|nr:glycosyltransferase family 4 protein [Campylobacterota bacterium]